MNADIDSDLQGTAFDVFRRLLTQFAGARLLAQFVRARLQRLCESVASLPEGQYRE